MILLFLLAALIPHQVLIATSRGQANIPVTTESGSAAVAAVLLARPLGLTVSLDGAAARVGQGGGDVDCDVGSTFLRYAGAADRMVGAPYSALATLVLP